MMGKKILAAAIALSCGIAFAETGLEGGSDGLHQQSAKTLGQGGISFGVGAQGVIDSKASAYNFYYTTDGQRTALGNLLPSVSFNVHAAIGLLDWVDFGIVLPVYYDDVYPDNDGELYGWGIGDLQTWLKVRLPVFDTSDVVNVALLGQMYAPTGDDVSGMRPRHAWYINPYGGTNAYTADDWALEASLLLTMDFNKMGIPLRWNSNIGYVGSIGEGSNTMLYGTGLNLTAIQALDIFLEYSGEMRVEKTTKAHSRDPLRDPMWLTPGVRLHLAKGVDLAVGFDLGITALIAEEDLRDKYVPVEKREDGQTTRYDIGAPMYGMSALLTWRGNPFKGSDDEDKDGVEDEKDECAHTPDGVKVNEKGCPLDEDNDKIPDYLDQCKGTPAGTAVDSIGCPVKKDTVATDTAKPVADTAKPAPIDTAAICAAISDSDKDNVADAQDKCPNTPAGAIVDSTGCPVDSDKDGVADGLDKCPNNPAGALVDNTGCPVDSDKDGVQDYKDKCPNTPENTKVDSVGCTLDSDKDGIIDAIDQCPNTLPGVEVNEVGCPIHKKEDLSQLRKGIQFKLNSAELTKKSFGTLNDIADLMNKHEQAKLEIQGHTDSKGTQEYNQNLSERRAQAVADYLIKKGIATDRVRAIGYGSTRPIADNKTKTGREANRRVELVPFN